VPADAALLDYQVCGFHHNPGPDRPPHGVLVVWPEIETNPPILTTATINNPQYDSDIYELGRLELFSISVETSWPALGSVRSPYVYQQPTSINRINNQINSAMANLQPNAATHITSGGFLGCVLPAGEEATFAFFVQTKRSVQQLLTTFRAVAYTATDVAPDITFSVRDYQGNTVGNVITHANMPVPRITGQTTVNPQDGTAMFMNGVLAGDQLWGMRDAMPLQDAAKGLAVRFTWGPNVENEIAWGQNGTTDAVYYGTITATANLYIYGFNCKVL
jgi:acetylornithine deacetylase/succinyl-diaminopimelate desuccinylase-like protein